MKLNEIIQQIESLSPLRFQDEWDNSGLQVGFPGADVSRALVCLDVTEAVVAEAAQKGCGLIVSHHPLIFKALRQVSDASYQQRCVVEALRHGIAIYSAHTSLDNAPGGVNFRIADMLGVGDLEWLSPHASGENAGSGVIGTLASPMSGSDFLSAVQEKFGVSCLRHSDAAGLTVRRVAICGGAGAFLMKDALRKGADCFVCGEFHYHDYFENCGMLLAELGHYQSEQFTIGLLASHLAQNCPGLEVIVTEINTNPIQYSWQNTL